MSESEIEENITTELCKQCGKPCESLDTEGLCHQCRSQDIEDPLPYCWTCYGRVGDHPPTLCHSCQKPLIDDSRRAADEKVWCGECYKKKIEEKDPRGPYCPFGVTSQKIKDPKHPLHSLYKALCSKAQITGDLLSSCTAWETRDKCWTMFDDAKNDLLPICPQCLEKLTKGKEESWQCKNEACSINVIFKKI